MTPFTLFKTCCNSKCVIIHVSQQEYELGNSYKYEAIVNLDITCFDFHEITSFPSNHLSTFHNKE